MNEVKTTQINTVTWKIWIDEAKKALFVKEVPNAVLRQLKADDVNFLVKKGYRIG